MIMVARLPRSWTSSTAWWCQVPAVSMPLERRCELQIIIIIIVYDPEHEAKWQEH